MCHNIKIQEAEPGCAKRVYIDGTWYPSINQVPMFTYASLYSYKRKHNLSTEEAIDGLLTYYEDLEKRKAKRAEFLAAERERISKKFIYHGEYFPSFSQAIRVIGMRHGVSLSIQCVFSFIKKRNLDKETGLDVYLHERCINR